MAKFIVGVLMGAMLAFGYVRYDFELPGILRLPERLHGNLVSSAVEQDLYDLDRSPAERTRALEIYFTNRAADAAALDASADHPFLNALYRERATREARQLVLSWPALDKTLDQPALRTALERKHGTTDTLALKQLMLHEALSDKPFLKHWLEAQAVPITRGTLYDELRRVSAK